jgi:hypothetical protein
LAKDGILIHVEKNLAIVAIYCGACDHIRCTVQAFDNMKEGFLWSTCQRKRTMSINVIIIQNKRKENMIKENLET